MNFINKVKSKVSSKIFGEETKDENKYMAKEHKELQNKVNIQKIYNKDLNTYIPILYNDEKNQERDKKLYEKFSKVLNLQIIGYDQLKTLSWNGIPSILRSNVWKIIVDYCPTNQVNSREVIKRKREEYLKYVDLYITEQTFMDENERKMYKTVLTDVPRTQPDYPLFKNKRIQEMLKRILFIWNIRHPACGYVQGMNEIITPFVVAFLTEYCDFDLRYIKVPQNFEDVSDEILSQLEADSYWCLSRILDRIQDNYTNGNPGLKRALDKMEQVVSKLDPELEQHFKTTGVRYIQFAFRWVLCLLIREFKLHLVLRLFDTYMSDEKGFSCLHIYVCAALVLKFSNQLKQMLFNEIIMFLQNIPTNDWSENDIELLLSEGYVFMSMFEQSQGHIKVSQTTSWV